MGTLPIEQAWSRLLHMTITALAYGPFLLEKRVALATVGQTTRDEGLGPLVQ